MAGMDPMKFLETADQVTILTMQAVAAEVAEIRKKQQEASS
jgi:hypothetical protein